MRQQKFRAWFGHHKKMVQSENLFLHYDGADGFDVAFDKTMLDDEGNAEPVMNFKVLEWTGLTDKHGVEIFEGDILNLNTNKERVWVQFWQGKFISMNVFKGKIISRSDYGSIDLELVRFGEVIGNTFEHPELLESGESK